MVMRDTPSPVAEVLTGLVTVNSSWIVEVGTPVGAGWIAGVDMSDASRGPLNDLLLAIGERAGTDDRRTIAASFALRFGWASVMAIAPFLRDACVPDIRLENTSCRFKESTFFERAAVHVPRGVVCPGDQRASHPLVTVVPDDQELLLALRHVLVTQAEPVVAALHAWSGFAPKGTWGMLTSSWASHFTGLWPTPDDHRGARPVVEAFFAGDDVVHQMRPRLHEVTHGTATHLYQRRSSCCRYYLLPQQGDLCASCPLVSQEERLVRNREWMRTQAERRKAAAGHA